MDWSIQEIARIAGTTSRALWHYDEIGLLKPSRIAHNGYRHYDQEALLHLQRILLLRELGLGLPVIADVLSNESDAATALRGHLRWLRHEQERLSRQILSVQNTIEAVNEGRELMAENMFDGFDHTQYKEEVEDRWGKDAYASSNTWWQGMDGAEKAAWKQRSQQLGSDWIAAASKGVAPDSDEAQGLARRQVEWLRGIPGTPASAPGGDLKGYVLGLGEMYVADPRFSANYGGESGAGFVREALRVYAEANL